MNLTDALVYTALYSRTTLSEKNGWVDTDGRIYISYSVESLAEDLHKGQTVIKAALRKLAAVGLIETKRNFGAPSTIYVKLPDGRNTDQLIAEKQAECKAVKPNEREPEKRPSNSRKSDPRTVGIPTVSQSENRPIDSRKSDPRTVGIPTVSQSENRPIDSRNSDPQSVGKPTTNYLSITKELNYKKREKPTRQKYGSYKNVFLSDAEYQKLKSEIPNLDNLIEQLSTYMESKGKRYKNHAATLRNWAARDKSRQKPPHGGGIPNYSYKDGESL